MIKAQVTGLDTLTQRTANAGAQLKARMQAGFEVQAATTCEHIRQNLAPHDKTGALSGSVRFDKHQGGHPNVTIRAGGTSDTMRFDKKTRQVYDEALLLEYGTKREAPHPFFHPAIESLKPAAVDSVKDQIKQADLTK